MDSDGPGHYRHLRKGQIRLLCLEPNTYDQVPRISFEIFDLPNSPPYDALSYAWGEESDGRATVIHVSDDTKIPVWINLFHGLQRLQDELVVNTNAPKWAWADALCINQDELEEKAVQIPIMGEIYKRANSVIIWLGHGSVKEEQALQKVQDMGSRLIGGPDSTGETFQDGITRMASAIPPPDDLDYWFALMEILSKSWWDRLWYV